MQSAPSSHLSSWTCLAGCDHTDPGRCCSLENMRELALDHDALIRRCVPVPARVHARRKLLQDLRGALVWIPPTANIISPGCLGSTGFHGMASLVVKVAWVAPAFAPTAGVAPVPRSCAKDCVVIVVASATTTLVNALLFSPRPLATYGRGQGIP
jgi:hypothetical protein